MALRSRRTNLARTPRRARIWTGTAIALAQLPPGNSLVTLVAEATFAIQGKPTIARMRGELFVMFDQSGAAAGEKVIVSCGIGLVNTQSVVGAAVPLPRTDIDWGGWMWLEHTCLAQPDTAMVVQNDQTWKRIDIDSKSMRKVPNNMTLVLVTEVTAITGTPDVETWGTLRVLMLPS